MTDRYEFINKNGIQKVFTDKEAYKKAVIADMYVENRTDWLVVPSDSVRQRHDACQVSVSAAGAIKYLEKYDIKVPKFIKERAKPTIDCWS